VLPYHEWPRLAHTDLAPALPDLDPARVQILVVEHHGVIVGCWAMAWCLHAECLWIDPEKRGKAGVLRNLLRAMQSFAPSVFSLVDPAIEPMAERIGIRLDGAPFLISLGQL